jgi:ubiquinone/menaquinone biosynthesis C-methylase UbiE
MATRHAWHDTWSIVDDTTDPGFFVRFLEMTRAPLLNAMRAAPERFQQAHLLERGHRVLDVGCGSGHFTQWFAEVVGPGGYVTGLDASQVLLDEARRRARGLGLPLEYMRGDAHRLPFPDGTFDRCYASLVLEHLEDPARALAELVRVTRQGGRVIVSATDFEDPELTQRLDPVSRQVQEVLRRTFRNGQLARRLPEMFFKSAGLSSVRVEEVRHAFERLNPVVRDMIQGSVERAVAEGRVTAAEGREHLADLERQDAEGRFRIAWHTLKVTGQKV